MIFPPAILRVKFQKDTRNIILWLPVFVIWPFLALGAIVLAPIVLVLAIAFWWTRWGRPMLRSGPAFFAMFCALRGLRIDVQKPDKRVHISFR